MWTLGFWWEHQGKIGVASDDFPWCFYSVLPSYLAGDHGDPLQYFFQGYYVLLCLTVDSKYGHMIQYLYKHVYERVQK